MKKKLLFILPLLTPLIMSCSNENGDQSYDPFMIGDNLEVISSTEAQLIANEAFDNLPKASSLRESKTSIEDTTKFYTGAFSQYSVNKKTTTDSEAVYYANKIETNRNISSTTYLGNDSTIEEQNTTTTEWYGIKPVKEGEVPSENYSLLSKTTEKYNGISSTRFSSVDDFSKPAEIEALWNRHLIDSIKTNYLPVEISYSPDLTYVRDNQHIVGYLSTNTLTTESSKVAPGKEEVSYVKKVEDLIVVDFYKDEVLEIGWTVRSVSSRTITTYLSTIDGKESESPIEVSKQIHTTSLSYDTQHQKSEDIPEYKINDYRPFSISKFAFDDEHTKLDYVTKYDCENNDDFYRHINDSFTGHAYYKEEKLEKGFYSFFDGEFTPETNVEKWGYETIINNKCVNYIIDPKDVQLNETDRAIINAHEHLFYVAETAKFSFRIVFNEDMSEASEFTVAIVGR